MLLTLFCSSLFCICGHDWLAWYFLLDSLLSSPRCSDDLFKEKELLFSDLRDPLGCDEMDSLDAALDVTDFFEDATVPCVSGVDVIFCRIRGCGHIYFIFSQS